MYINRAIIYGNLTRDPEKRALPSGMQVAEFGVATNRSWKGKEGGRQEATEYHNVVAFGKQAELIAQYLHKGSPIYVEGRIQTRSWEAKDGTGKRYRTEIVVENFQFGPKNSGAGGGNYDNSSASSASGSVSKSDSKDKETEIEYPEEEINAEDIPF